MRSLDSQKKPELAEHHVKLKLVVEELCLGGVVELLTFFLEELDVGQENVYMVCL